MTKMVDSCWRRNFPKGRDLNHDLQLPIFVCQECRTTISMDLSAISKPFETKEVEKPEKFEFYQIFIIPTKASLNVTKSKMRTFGSEVRVFPGDFLLLVPTETPRTNTTIPKSLLLLDFWGVELPNSRRCASVDPQKKGKARQGKARQAVDDIFGNLKGERDFTSWWLNQPI